MTQTATPAKLSPTDKRYGIIREITAPINDEATMKVALKDTGIPHTELTLDEFKAMANRMDKDAYALGRTERWQSACEFARREIRAAEEAGTLDVSFARWAVVQGSVWMTHAA
jgi:hypothetical protein